MKLSRRLANPIIKLVTLFFFVGLAIPVSAGEHKGKFIISAANPHASQAGFDILSKGGSAVDAAIATQMVLTLVEPQSSGIGGGAFFLHYDNKSQKVTTFNGREKAPAAVTPDLFLKSDGTPQKFYDAVVGGKAVGVPGIIAMMELAHKKHGNLPWKDLFEPAIRLAENGFEISPRLHFLLNRDKFLKNKEPARSYFYTAEGEAKPVRTLLKNPELAASLRLIAEQGSDGFYKGPLAEKIVAAVKSDPQNPGLLTMEDMASYSAQEKEPVCSLYRGNNVCGMGMPTSGGVTSQQILKLVEPFNLSAHNAGSEKAVHLISEASALAFSDRGLYLADDDFVTVPVKGLLSDTYLQTRRSLISEDRTGVPFEAGDPSKKAGLLSPDDAIELPSTSHFSIVDGNGNAVSITTSVENVFGSRLMAGGFILNNQLTDFSFRPEKDGKLINNRIEPGKRPRSSMSPSIVLDSSGNLKMVIGSPGGSRIIGYVTKTIIGVLDWNLSMQEAIDLPHHINRNGTLDLEQGTILEALLPAMEAKGYKVKIRTLNSGLHGILVTDQGYEGGADPRREGVVLQN
ncbi:gamma-glutamyltransferase [Sneathiella sp. P13V-1]|uniref:gamma-glutamyltransferase n=1 Tax=Sneathiella sp. P13V-1 TaxID=2697366 RepID=UPI00187BC047|nr:gamma-glutamyltransferase [Sneathiella sp. P13V-1]MBE7635406.1 gamma-glutamyltransferase [Sneathiella sp. P13V-1]